MSSSQPQIDEPDDLIAEGIVTTVNPDGSANISPMGPRVNRDFTHLVFRPFQTSTTYQNLKRTGEGVFHITDDVLLIAKAAVGKLTPQPALQPAPHVGGFLLADACRWFAFRVSTLDDSQERGRSAATSSAVAPHFLRPSRKTRRAGASWRPASAFFPASKS
jgi:hypothetical protein